MTFTYDPSTDAGLVRLLLNDMDETTGVFTDDEITAFLALEGGSVKRAAAQAIDTNADNEALASKVFTTEGTTTNGAALAAALHARATTLRTQALDDEQSEGFFEAIDTVPDCWPPQLSGWS